jgi:hypothetical protein
MVLRFLEESYRRSSGGIVRKWCAFLLCFIGVAIGGYMNQQSKSIIELESLLEIKIDL